MFDKLQAAENRYEEINNKLLDPEVLGDQNEYRKLMKEHSDLEEIVAKYGEYKKINKEIEEAKELLGEKLDREF
ncbi:MAG TPA: PCRF domain-containing protein, partial [Acetivibrio saccincola]|nr:PCRF domain-containing protein [Acetivibrio saccincola]